MSHARAVASLGIALVISCGREAPTGPGEPLTLRILSGDGISDTVGAPLGQELVIEVRGPNGVVRGALVQFQALAATDPARQHESTILMSVPVTDNLSSLVESATDANGQARVDVKLGSVPGQARVVVRAPSLSLADTATYTVLPGAPAIVRVGLRDTLVYSGAKYQLHATSADRFDNPRPGDVFTYVAGPSYVVSVSPSGEVTAGDGGRGWIAVNVNAGSHADTSRISVIPPATIAVEMPVVGGLTIATLDLDGSHTSPLSTIIGNNIQLYPRFSPSGARILYTAGDPTAGDAQLFLFDVNANTSRALVSASAGLVSTSWGWFSPDEQWVYFSARHAGELNGIYRAHLDGSGVSVVVPPDPGLDAWRGALSPDGKKLVYVVGDRIRVLDLSSGVVSPTNVVGTHPHFSPDGQSIAYTSGGFSGHLFLMHADGTQSRMLAPLHQYADSEGFDFTNDGRWIVIKGHPFLEVVSVTNEQVVTLDYSLGMFQPSVKR
jgi:WD40-like Beta Propeller Repeat